jgi:hypothetical protein
MSATDIILRLVLALLVLLAVYVAGWAWVVFVTRYWWRQRGKGFAEGWFMVVDEREGRTLRRELYPGQRRQVVPEPPTTPAPTLARPDETTGKPADAGHRWLGGTK